MVDLLKSLKEFIAKAEAEEKTYSQAEVDAMVKKAQAEATKVEAPKEEPKPEVKPAPKAEAPKPHVPTEITEETKVQEPPKVQHAPPATGVPPALTMADVEQGRMTNQEIMGLLNDGSLSKLWHDSYGRGNA